MRSRFATPLLLLLALTLLPGCAIVSGVVAVGDAVVGGVLDAGAAVVDTVTPDFSSKDEKPKKTEEAEKKSE